MVIDYHDYKNKLLLKKRQYVKDKRLDFLYEKLFEWEVQEARKGIKENEREAGLVETKEGYILTILKLG